MLASGSYVRTYPKLACVFFLDGRCLLFLIMSSGKSLEFGMVPALCSRFLAVRACLAESQWFDCTACAEPKTKDGRHLLEAFSITSCYQ